jgi:NitT/TauT family transport system ATP-binding protein
MTDEWLKIESLSFGYSTSQLFSELSLTVPVDCPIVGILGPSGIGKTTLLNLIAGFEVATKGSIRVHDEVVNKPSANRPVVFQEHNLFPWKTVSKNIEPGLCAMKLKKPDRREKVYNLLDAMGLGQCGSRYPRELSGGMQQRVGLARAMAVSPQCILMDEPFSALDEATRESVRNFFKQTLETNSTNAIIVTHDAAEALEICDYLIIINSKGKVTAIESNMIDLGNLRIVLSDSFESKKQY